MTVFCTIKYYFDIWLFGCIGEARFLILHVFTNQSELYLYGIITILFIILIYNRFYILYINMDNENVPNKLKISAGIMDWIILIY